MFFVLFFCCSSTKETKELFLKPKTVVMQSWKTVRESWCWTRPHHLCIELPDKETTKNILDRLSCISVTKECLKVYWGAFPLVTLACLFFQKTYLATFLALLLQPCNEPTAQGQICKMIKTTNLTRNVAWFIGFLNGGTNLTIEWSISTKHYQIVSIPWTLCVSTQKECNWGDQNMVEVMAWFYIDVNSGLYYC